MGSSEQVWASAGRILPGRFRLKVGRTKQMMLGYRIWMNKGSMGIWLVSVLFGVCLTRFVGTGLARRVPDLRVRWALPPPAGGDAHWWLSPPRLRTRCWGKKLLLCFIRASILRAERKEVDFRRRWCAVLGIRPGLERCEGDGSLRMWCVWANQSLSCEPAVLHWWSNRRCQGITAAAWQPQHLPDLHLHLHLHLVLSPSLRNHRVCSGWSFAR